MSSHFGAIIAIQDHPCVQMDRPLCVSTQQWDHQLSASCNNKCPTRATNSLPKHQWPLDERHRRINPHVVLSAECKHVSRAALMETKYLLQHSMESKHVDPGFVSPESDPRQEAQVFPHAHTHTHTHTHTSTHTAATWENGCPFWEG